ncbi:MAG: hypothetical protein GNW80_13170 [Asgard group archaeon]|nr:hypothetical protein [Asgard group archaeon]
MKRKTKRIWLNFIGLMLFPVLMFSITGMVAGVVISDTVTLGPLGEEVIQLKMHDDDTAAISITMTSGQIYVEIYESEYFDSRIYVEEDWGPVISTFSTEFEPLWSDTFYIVLYNADTMNSASFSYTIDHDQAFQSNMIINLAIAGALLGVILVVNFTGKKNPNISS